MSPREGRGAEGTKEGEGVREGTPFLALGREYAFPWCPSAPCVSPLQQEPGEGPLLFTKKMIKIFRRAWAEPA